MIERQPGAPRPEGLKDLERQIVTRGGQTVVISPEGKGSNFISYSIGGTPDVNGSGRIEVPTLEQVNEQPEAEFKALRVEKSNLEVQLFNLSFERLLREHPDLEQRVLDRKGKAKETMTPNAIRSVIYDAILFDTEFDLRDEFGVIQKQIAEENVDIVNRIAHIQAILPEAEAAFHSFDGYEGFRDLKAGQEAVLFCTTENTGGLGGKLDRSSEHDVTGISVMIKGSDDIELPPRTRSRDDLLLKLKELEEQGIQDQVAHILQVNVLGKSRGRGNAQALLEATLWDTEQNKNVAFTYAEVLTTNEDSGAAMIKAFIKAGFEPFFVKEQHSHSSYRPAYYLFVKENPDFEKTQQSRNRFARN